MKWVAREPVKVDRGACPWPIKTFADPDPEFLVVSLETVMHVADSEWVASDALHTCCRERVENEMKERR